MAPGLAWFALKVRAKSEPLVKSLLERKGFESFAPTYPDPRRYTDRIRKAEAALFPGYVFSRFDPAHTLPIVTTPAVHKILSIGPRLQPIDDSEIESLRRITANGLARPFPFMNAGQKVRVCQGPFTGVEGLFLLQKSASRLIITIEILQRSVAVEVDSSDVRACLS